MAAVGRSIGYSFVLTLALAALAFLVDRSADPIIDEFEKVIVPCQHGGEWVSAKETCRCLGPWAGKYCGECACENGGVCDTLNIQVATLGTLWGCRCPDRLVGPLCEQCNADLTDDGRCAGPCKDRYAGPDCNRLCSATPAFEDVVLDADGDYNKELEMLNYGGELHLCSGHGQCDNATGFCQCQPFYFPSEDGRSSCARTCPLVNNTLCAGHGRCDDNAGVISCACEFGYHLAPACNVACPGMETEFINEACSGRGSCFLASPGIAACECGELFIGEACQYRCPTGAIIESSEACSGHGECREDFSSGYTKAVCDCESPFEGPGCGCTRSLTCSGHGDCRGDGTCSCDVDSVYDKPVFRGERCNKCIPGHYGSDCRLQCTSFEPAASEFEFQVGRKIHCHGRGTCAVSNFGLADESVVCGACSGNFATESHCEECKDKYYPKLSVMNNDDVASCTTFATRTTCNGAGEPKDTFGRKTSTVEPQCDCDAPHADALSFCSKCELSYYPFNLKEDPKGACSRRCVDKELIDQGVVVSVAHVETLECKNDGLCADDGVSCICADGYSGTDCGIACGEPDENGQQCSGHGQCVANALQQFLEFEINVRGFDASRCECSPQDDLTEAERLAIFRGELTEQTGEATTGRNKRDWYGDTCGFGCLAAPWKDSTECNSERCEVMPVNSDAGNPIMECTQDSQCGSYENGILKFLDANGDEKTELSSEESALRGAVSLSRRWSKRTGPFCHVMNTPFSVWEPSMKCTQRVNKDGEDLVTEAECHQYTTRYDCLHKGEGACHYVDVCMEALNDFDTWSYCYELMRTQEPPALRTKGCAESCNSTLLNTIEWGKKCAHYRERVPADLCTEANAMQNLDELCDLAETAGVDSTKLVSGCERALPPDGVAFTAPTALMDAADASAFCWEVSDRAGSVRYPFNFTALLDTPEARHLQAAFHSLFTELGLRDACAADSEVDPGSCANIPSADDAQAKVLYLCSDDGEQVLKPTDESGLTVSCEALPTVLDVSPFEMVCSESLEGLSEINLEDAVRLAARRGCALRAKTALHASSVAVDNDMAMAVCKAVLDAESPSACEQACGPEDQCSDLGTTRDGKRVLQCRRPDASDVGIDASTGKCVNCLLGDCSVTGREGGAEYRCVVPASEIAESATPPRFEPCDDTLLLHLDELGGGRPEVSSVQGQRKVEIYGTNETVMIYGAGSLDAPVLNGVASAALVGESGVVHAGDATAEVNSGTVARPPPARVEFDVRLASEGRGRVAVLGKNGTLVSLLMHYYGGFGYDVNAPTENDLACGVGEEDNCKFIVVPGVNYRVIMTFDWETELVSVKFSDQSSVVRNITMQADDFVGVAASGAARVSQLWVFSNKSTVCATLHRSLGRSLTMQASYKPAVDQPKLSMSFCAGVEKAVGGHVRGCAHEREAVFEVPWHDYCAYTRLLKSKTGTGDCGNWQGDQALTIACEPVLSKFATPDCAKNAMLFDWETEYCAPLRNDTKPDELTTANCSAECITKVAEDDFAQLCDDRDKYWDAIDETAKPDFLPADCSDNGKWEKVDWVHYCTEKAENTAKGYCSAAVCDCRGQGGWMAGDACELECPMADDYSPCAEDSLGGTCTYRRKDSAAADAFYEDPDNNLIKNHPVMQIQGRCACSHPDALAEEGCKVECDSPDGGPACNSLTYMSNGTEWQLSACDAGGSGVCRCMSPLARRVNTTVTNWKGQSMNVLAVEFGDHEGTNTTAFPGMSAFRLYAHQGAKQLMMRYFNAMEATWETTKLKFESSPAEFDCGGRECDFHDVVIAQSLYSSSSFFGGSCSRRCPGVDTGEDMVKMDSGCDVENSTLSGKDRVSEEGCQSECLDDFRCLFSKWEAATSDCYMFSTCVLLAPEVDVPAGALWRQRKSDRSPNLTPCNSRGQCGLTGQCHCDPAKLLSLTHPITGEKNLIPSNQRHGLSSTPITTLDLTGYRGDACEKVCPGYNETRKSMADVCSGHGICTRAGTCQCDVNYVGVNCELRCPVKDLAVEDDQTVCAGHGTCSEARVFAGYDATEEDSKRYYMVTEAYRKWHNECPTNAPIDYFVLPFEEFPGSVSSADIVGGPECLNVPQEQDDPTLPFLNRPEIKLEGLSDYELLDDEKALASESALSVGGTSNFDRQGVFRRRYWYDEGNGALQEQTLFVESYARVEALYNESAVAYDKFYGYRCGVEMEANVQPTDAVKTVADCAGHCRALSDCGCFHYREFYHRRFRGECVLGKAGPLVAYPVEKVAYIHTTNGFLQKLDASYPGWAEAPPTPFDAFDETYVQLHSSDAFPASCRAPASSLGTNVASVDACAALCVAATTDGGVCTYFSYDPYSRRCSQVRTTSAECVEGMSPNPAGFYAVSLANTGAIAPTAYTRSGSARIFPYSVAKRGTLTGTYVGRARPGYETAIASCDCLSSAAWGFWDGHRCHTCQKHYGSRTCSRRCPGVTVADEPCFGYGKCLWGSKDGEGEEFYEARCLCGDPPAPYFDDLATVGTWGVEEFELYVKANFNGLPPSEAYEDPRNYNFASSTCAGCKEGFGGLNCASTCSYCLFSGVCSFTPSTVSVSVPCTCSGNDYDPFNSCCPLGFSMLESLVHNDVVLLTTSLRRKRLTQDPGRAVILGKFYDSAVFPKLKESENPSRRWCAPGPGMFETEWLKSDTLKDARVCAGEGTVRDRGVRKLVVGATPAKYNPQFCSDLGSDADGHDYWKPLQMTLWYAHPGKVFLASLGDHTTSMAYATADGVTVSDSSGSPPSSTADYTFEQFAEACRAKCILESCSGVVVREDESAQTYACFLNAHIFIGTPHSDVYVTLPGAEFTAYKKQRQPEFCENVDDSGKTCVLGATGYGDVPLCAEMSLGDANGDTETTVLNLGNQCQVKTEGDAWVGVDSSLCSLFPAERVRINEDTDVLSRLVPDANALLFGAYGNTQYEASAGEMVAKIGVMRPENPCSVLAGDYFWNKNDRTQCISASTQQTCNIKDWQHCANYELTEQALTYVHSVVESQGTYPHRLAVLEKNYEVFLVKPNYQYRVNPFDSTALQKELDDYKAAALSAETAKQNQIGILDNDINFERVETTTYFSPHVYNSGTTDVAFGSNSEYAYSFYERLAYYDFDPITWPREQVTGCISGGYDKFNRPVNLNAPPCLPMGLQQLDDVFQQIYDRDVVPLDDFFLTEKEWTLERELLANDLLEQHGTITSNLLTKFWDYEFEEKTFFGSRLLLMCVYEMCYLRNRGNLVQSALEREHSFDKCYVGRHYFHPGYRYYESAGEYDYFEEDTYDYFSDDDVCPTGCHLKSPSGSESCYTCEKDGTNGKCIYTNNYVVPGANCLNVCTAEKLADYKEWVVMEGNYQGYSKNIYPSRYRSITGGTQLYKNVVERHDEVKTMLNTKNTTKTDLEKQLETLKAANAAETLSLENALAAAEADAFGSSCDETAPCDICQGHCEGSDNECKEGLSCISAGADAIRTHCGGEADAGTDYCLPTDWETSNVDLYVAGAMTALSTVSTWLVEVGVDGTTSTSKPFVNGEQANKNKQMFEECMHDCNNDYDCLPHLKCFQRDSTEPVPGCHGAIPSGHDACYDPTASLQVLAARTRTDHAINVHKEVLEARAMPSILTAEHATDKFEIKGSVHSIGAAGTEFPFGHAPWFLPADIVIIGYNNNSPSGTIPMCGGDCDLGQCMPGLKCFQRDKGEKTPGCKGTPNANNVDYCYNPDTASGKAPPRALLTVTAEQCAQLCEKTYGCTAAHWEELKCYLFHFDPSMGCSLFKDLATWFGGFRLKNIDRSNNNDNAKNLGECKGDCDTQNDNCAAGLKCFETASNDRVPGCKGSTGAYDICYDPAKMNIGFVKNPDACQLCKQHGLYAHVDAASTNSDWNSENILCAYENGKGADPNTCAVFPKLDSDDKYIWDYDSSTPFTGPRCAPTRAGVESGMYSNTMYVGKTFLESSYMMLRAHPEVTTFSQCKLACGSDDLCRAWQFEEDFDALNTEVAYTLAKTAACQDSDLDWMLSHYPSHSHATGVGGEKVAIKLTHEECSALCTSRQSCTGFRMHTGTNSPGDGVDKGLGCEIFKGPCSLAADPSSPDYNPCPPTNPELQKWSSSNNDYWCYSNYPNSPCRMSNSQYPPPTGFVWGTNQQDCKLWHYWVKTYKGVHTCKLFDFAPVAMSTGGASADTFSASTRVGYVERDFSPKIAFFDDGEHPSCDCFEGSTAYNCACKDESFVPYSSKPTDSVYGCAGHGRCASLEYKCVCNDGYAWIWGGKDAASDEEGHTCRQCAAGTFKDKSVSSCTRCPLGTYQDEEAAAKCKMCPLGFATLSAGAFSVSSCTAKTKIDCDAGFHNPFGQSCAPCPAGLFSDRRNAVECNACAVGRYSATTQQSGCSACPKGFYQDEYAKQECKACASGTFSSAEGASECLHNLCNAGQFSPTLVATDCNDCPLGFFQNSLIAFSCQACPEGFFQENEKSDSCAECPAGWSSLAQAMLCTETVAVEEAEADV